MTEYIELLRTLAKEATENADSYQHLPINDVPRADYHALAAKLTKLADVLESSPPGLQERLEGRLEGALANLHFVWQHWGDELIERVRARMATW